MDLKSHKQYLVRLPLVRTTASNRRKEEYNIKQNYQQCSHIPLERKHKALMICFVLCYTSKLSTLYT